MICGTLDVITSLLAGARAGLVVRVVGTEAQNGYGAQVVPRHKDRLPPGPFGPRRNPVTVPDRGEPAGVKVPDDRRSVLACGDRPGSVCGDRPVSGAPRHHHSGASRTTFSHGIACRSDRPRPANSPADPARFSATTPRKGPSRVCDHLRPGDTGSVRERQHHPPLHGLNSSRAYRFRAGPATGGIWTSGISAGRVVVRACSAAQAGIPGSMGCRAGGVHLETRRRRGGFRHESVRADHRRRPGRPAVGTR
jgi:hypothetical protein